MTDVHALAHRDCGGFIGVDEQTVERFISSDCSYLGTEDILYCKKCREQIEDYFEECYTDADDIEWLVARLFQDDGSVELIDEDPAVWGRKTDDGQARLAAFEVVDREVSRDAE